MLSFMSPAAFISIIRQVSSAALPWSSMPVVLHLSLPSPSLKPPHRKPRHSTLKGLKTPTTAAPATPETISACQAAQVPSQPHLPPPQLTSPVQLPLQPLTHPRRRRPTPPPRPKPATSFRPPTASSGFVDCSCATCRGTRHWSSPVGQGDERVGTSTNVSEHGAGFCG